MAFGNGADERGGAFPACEPCCLDDLWLVFPEEQQEQDLAKLLVFVRLWRKLRESCCFCYSFAQLRDICDVLQLYKGGALNPDFIRQLAAFQMLRDHFAMELADPGAAIPPAAIDADRTQLLALWVGASAAEWPWAVRQLITRVEQQARRRYECDQRAPEFLKLLTDNLDPLSRLAGFDPGSATDSWHALPTHTLRFAEVLAKIYASDFSVGELIFLFTAGPHLDGDDPFPLQEANEALDVPLGLPDDEPEHALWRLRRELLAARTSRTRTRTGRGGASRPPCTPSSASRPATSWRSASTSSPASWRGPVTRSARRRRVSAAPPRGGHVGADVEHPARRTAALRPRRAAAVRRVPLSDRAVIGKLTESTT